MIVLHNPTNSTVKDYPIQNEKTKEVKLWGIAPGQTLEFPDYVGQYLLEVYGFLQKVMTEDQYKEEQAEKAKIEQGKVYTQVKIIPEEKKQEVEKEAAKGVEIEAPKPQPGFTNENMKPKSDEIACKDVNCKAKFTNARMMEIHYSFKHKEVPK